MSNTNDIKQTISELYRIQGLWNDYKRNDSDYEDLEAEKKEAEHNVVRKWVEKAKDFELKEKEKLPSRAKIPSGWSAVISTPISINWEKPIQTIIITAASRLLATYGLIAPFALMILVGVVGGILSIIPGIGSFLGMLIALPGYLLVGGIFIASIINVFVWGSENNKENISKCLTLYRNLNSTSDAEWENKFNSGITDEAIENFYKEFKNYDNAFLDFAKKCDEKVSEIIEKYGEERNAVSLEYIEKMQEKLDANTPIIDELKNQTFIHTDYVPYASRIANLLETGRADTLKEAINLMLDDMRKDREEEERREAAYRQEEETRRHNMAMQRVAEQEARDARAHNEAMERAARDQAAAAKAQAAAAKAQAAAAQKAADDARRQAQQADKARRDQEYRAKSEASRRCNTCANAGKCSMFGMVNCAAFRPR